MRKNSGKYNCVFMNFISNLKKTSVFKYLHLHLVVQKLLELQKVTWSYKMTSQHF